MGLWRSACSARSRGGGEEDIDDTPSVKDGKLTGSPPHHLIAVGVAASSAALPPHRPVRETARPSYRSAAPLPATGRSGWPRLSFRHRCQKAHRWLGYVR